jgi:hypothetical protein
MGDNLSRQKDNPISNDLTGIYNIGFMKIVLLTEEINRRYKESVSVCSLSDTCLIILMSIALSRHKGTLTIQIDAFFIVTLLRLRCT